MKIFLTSMLLLFTIIFSAPASAGAITKACRQSGQPSATPQVCGCLQSLADVTMERSERRRIAKFFKNPDKAQKVRQSSSRRDSDFWLKYRAFGELAQQVCG